MNTIYIITQLGQVVGVTYCDSHAGQLMSMIPQSKVEAKQVTSGYSDLAYVVTVGEGDKTRIVDVFTDRGAAAKVASSLNARLRKFEISDSDNDGVRFRFYKSFVDLDGGRDNEDYCEDCDSYSCDCYDRCGETVYYVDSFIRRHRRADRDEFSAPFITRRRRYSSSLPNRFEVAAQDREDSLDIAIWWERNKRRYEDMEYNVDYKVVIVNGTYDIDAKLLKQKTGV